MTDKEEREVLRRYLRQYLSAKRRKCDLERRRAQLQQDIQCPLGAVRYDGMPRSGSPSEGAAAFAYRIDEVEQRIRAQQAEMARAAAGGSWTSLTFWSRAVWNARSSRSDTWTAWLARHRARYSDQPQSGQRVRNPCH